MKKSIFTFIWLMASLVAWGQNIDYYRYIDDPSLAKVDAQSSFDSGDYDMTITLIHHYERFGNSDGRDLLAKAQKCQQLFIEASQYENQGGKSAAIQCYKGILDINPNDKAAKAKVDSFEAEILQDAELAFQSGDYNRAADLCEYVGGDKAKTLKEKSLLCSEHTDAMNDLFSNEQLEEACEIARILLAINPNDENAQKVLAFTPTTTIQQEHDGNMESIQTPPDNNTPPIDLSIGSINGHDWVDLGLSVKWATCNVGASSPSDYGSYFAWAEISEKNRYGLINLRYHYSEMGVDGKVNDTFTKYNTMVGYGPVDNKYQLEASDDVARTNWGDTWRIPSNSEIMELLEKCTWTWTTQGGKRGYEVKSKINGNSIFLPAAGYKDESDLFTAGFHGYYWSSSLYSYIPDYAWLLFFSLSDSDEYYSNRRYGFSVRPVTE